MRRAALAAPDADATWSATRVLPKRRERSSPLVVVVIDEAPRRRTEALPCIATTIGAYLPTNIFFAVRSPSTTSS
jgi:hypothetical protein